MPSNIAKKTQRDDIDLSDIPEISDEQWARARRGRSRYADKRVELPLEGIRKAFGKTQVEVARGSGMNQGNLSRLENRDDLDDVELGTLRRYVEACGGELELVVKAPNGGRIFVRDQRVVTIPRVAAKKRRRSR